MGIFRGAYAPAAMLLSGFVLWSAAFLAIYMAQATGCRLGWDEAPILGAMTAQRAVLVALFLLACVGHLLLIARFPHPDERSRFAFRMGRMLAYVALASSAFCFSVVFWLTAC